MLKQRTFLSNKSGLGSVFNTLVATEDHGHRVLVEQAVHEMKRGANKVALSYLNKALQLSPDDVDCLLHKAVCLVRIQDFQTALTCVDMASNYPIEGFRSSPSRPYAIRGEAHYHMGEFEKSLMFFYRALYRCTNGSDEEEIR